MFAPHLGCWDLVTLVSEFGGNSHFLLSIISFHSISIEHREKWPIIVKLSDKYLLLTTHHNLNELLTKVYLLLANNR